MDGGKVYKHPRGMGGSPFSFMNKVNSRRKHPRGLVGAHFPSIAKYLAGKKHIMCFPIIHYRYEIIIKTNLITVK